MTKRENKTIFSRVVIQNPDRRVILRYMDDHRVEIEETRHLIKSCSSFSRGQAKRLLHCLSNVLSKTCEDSLGEINPFLNGPEDRTKASPIYNKKRCPICKRLISTSGGGLNHLEAHVRKNEATRGIIDEDGKRRVVYKKMETQASD